MSGSHTEHGHSHAHGHDHGDPFIALAKWAWRKVSPANRRRVSAYNDLCEAIGNGDNLRFKALLEDGADFTFAPAKQPPVALLCIEQGTPDMLRALLEAGLDPNTQIDHAEPLDEPVHDIVRESCPLLSHAIETGRTGMAMVLLADKRTDAGRTGISVHSEPRGYRLHFHPAPLQLAKVFNLTRVARKLEERRAWDGSHGPKPGKQPRKTPQRSISYT